MALRGLFGALLVIGCGRVGFDPLTPPADAAFEEPAEFLAGSRLRPNVFIGDDGSVLFRSWYDSALDTDCLFSQIAGEQRCFPRQITLASYADAACTQPYAGILP